MTVASAVRAHSPTLEARTAGFVRLIPPRRLCGELEVYDRHEPIAVIGSEFVVAPGAGFIVRTLVSDGAFVPAGTGIVVYSVVGE